MIYKMINNVTAIVNTATLLTGYYTRNLRSYNPGLAFISLRRFVVCLAVMALVSTPVSQPRKLTVLIPFMSADRRLLSRARERSC